MLHAEIHGPAEAPPVVLLHGFMGRAADWHPIIDRLGDGFRCLALDLPGHGRSTGLPDEAYTMPGAADAVRETLAGLGVGPCALVGYSMGGRLALLTALRHPGLVRRLVLESASPGLEDVEERRARQEVDEGRAREIEGGDFRAFLEAWYRSPLFATLANHDLTAALVADRLAHNDPAELAKALRGMSPGGQPPLWERLPDLHVSTLALAGALDGAYVELAERMKLARDGIHTATLADAGHNLHAERPDAVADVLRSFLSKF